MRVSQTNIIASLFSRFCDANYFASSVSFYWCGTVADLKFDFLGVARYIADLESGKVDIFGATKVRSTARDPLGDRSPT